MSLVFGAVFLVAVVIYAWASQVAPYAAPWSAPWQVVKSAPAAAAANAALRLALPAAVVIAILVVWPYSASPAQVTIASPSPQATVGFSPGRFGMREAIWTLVVLAVTATIALAVVMRRVLGDRLSRRAQTDVAAESTGLGTWADEGIAEILAERDPRRAILACYAVMERRLGAIGIQRGSDETALEYARRLLERSGAPPQPIAALTDLFHLAGYSSHDITESMRQRAVDSLQAIREAAA